MLPRKILHTEKQKLIDHIVQDMVGEDRRLRFGYPAPDASVESYIERSWERIGKSDQWFVVEDKGRIVATCHVSFVTDKQAEMGCTVAPEYKSQGIGQQLFDRGANWARAKGATHVYMQCLSENQVIQHIARKNGMTTITLAPGEKEATVKIERSELAAVAHDNVTETIAICDGIVRSQQWLFESILKRSLGLTSK